MTCLWTTGERCDGGSRAPTDACAPSRRTRLSVPWLRFDPVQRSPDAIPELVLLHLWGVSPSGVPSAVARMGTHRLLLRKAQGLRFAKLLGTGDGRTFTARDADPLHWGLLTVWDDAHDGERFAAENRVVRSWRKVATETLVVRLSPIAARGQWAGDTPFGDPRPRPVPGQVASITRATARRDWPRCGEPGALSPPRAAHVPGAPRRPQPGRRCQRSPRPPATRHRRR